MRKHKIYYENYVEISLSCELHCDVIVFIPLINLACNKILGILLGYCFYMALQKIKNFRVFTL